MVFATEASQTRGRTPSVFALVRLSNMTEAMPSVQCPRCQRSWLPRDPPVKKRVVVDFDDLPTARCGWGGLGGNHANGRE
jgi:hypothetical protein